MLGWWCRGQLVKGGRRSMAGAIVKGVLMLVPCNQGVRSIRDGSDTMVILCQYSSPC